MAWPSQESPPHATAEHIRAPQCAGTDVFELPLKYQIGKLIGKNGPYPICSAFDLDNNKCVSIMKISNAFVTIKNARKAFRRIKTLPLRNHKNIVGFIKIIPPYERFMYEEFYIVYEYMSWDLQHIIYSGIQISWKNVLYQILCGIKYLLSGHPAVKTLTLNNVLLNQIDDDNWEVKISDFYIGREHPDTLWLSEYVEPALYQAPELLLKSPVKSLGTVMWSVGCIFMELLTGTPLFAGVGGLDTLDCIFKVLGIPSADAQWYLTWDQKNWIRGLPDYKPQPLTETFPDVDPLAIDLALKMLVFNPNKRITAAAALAHPYLAEMHVLLGPVPVGTPFNNFIDLEPFGLEQLKYMIFEEFKSYDK